MLQVIFPKTSVLSAISPFHYTETLHLVLDVVAEEILVPFWWKIKPKPLEFVVLPMTLIYCTVFPFFGPEPAMFAIDKRTLVIITLGTFHLAKTMLAIKCKFSNEDVALQVRGFTVAISSP